MAGGVNSQGQVMWPIGQIAERDKVSKAAVSKMVTKLVKDHQLPVDLDGRGRVIGVSIAHYDHHRGLFSSSAKTPVRPEVEPDAPMSESRDEALRQQAWIDVGRKRLDHAKEVGQLARADRVAEGLEIAGRAIQGVINRLPNRADDIALAVSKEGTSGARLLLRKIATELSVSIADALDQVAARAPAQDDVSEDLVE